MIMTHQSYWNNEKFKTAIITAAAKHYGWEKDIVTSLIETIEFFEILDQKNDKGEDYSASTLMSSPVVQSTNGNGWKFKNEMNTKIGYTDKMGNFEPISLQEFLNNSFKLEQLVFQITHLKFECTKFKNGVIKKPVFKAKFNSIIRLVRTETPLVELDLISNYKQKAKELKDSLNSVVPNGQEKENQGQKRKNKNTVGGEEPTRKIKAKTTQK